MQTKKLSKVHTVNKGITPERSRSTLYIFHKGRSVFWSVKPITR